MAYLTSDNSNLNMFNQYKAKIFKVQHQANFLSNILDHEQNKLVYGPRGVPGNNKLVEIPTR